MPKLRKNLSYTPQGKNYRLVVPKGTNVTGDVERIARKVGCFTRNEVSALATSVELWLLQVNKIPGVVQSFAHRGDVYVSVANPAEIDERGIFSKRIATLSWPEGFLPSHPVVEQMVSAMLASLPEQQ